MGVNLCCTREICCDADHYNPKTMDDIGSKLHSPTAAKLNKRRGSRRDQGIFTESPRQNKLNKNNIRLEYVNRVQQYKV